MREIFWTMILIALKSTLEIEMHMKS